MDGFDDDAGAEQRPPSQQAYLEPSLAQLRSRLTTDPAIRENLVALLWIGSRSRRQDLHEASDFDLQIILSAPAGSTTAALRRILPDYPAIDLSIVYLKDIFNAEGALDFQDGTKGPFFLPVLADGVLLYGRNVYQPVMAELSLDSLRPSLLFTIREYLARLRVMVVYEQSRSFDFQKYSLKLLKDVLVYSGSLSLRDMAAASHKDVLSLIRQVWTFPQPAARALEALIDFSLPDVDPHRIALLDEYERLVASLLSRQCLDSS